MNPNSKNDEKLDSLLRGWTVDASLPLRFQERVWERIARAEPSPRPSWRRNFEIWVESVFSGPKFAFSYIAVLLAVGALTGFWRAQDRSAETQAHWRARYVQSVDPYLMPRN